MKQKKQKKTGPDKKAEPEKTPEELKEQIQELLTEKQVFFEKLQRVSADYINYQKRAPKQIADSVAYEKKAIIRSLLPSLDNFNHALAGADTAQGPEALEGIIKGLRMVYDHMLDALKSHGVEQIDALGAEFDPAMHEAMQTRCEEDKAENIILEEFQKGYALNGLVLRPSKVIVNKLAVKEAPDKTPEKTDQKTPTENEQDNDPNPDKPANEE